MKHIFKKTGIIVLIIIVTLSILLISSKYIVENVFFNPFKDYELTSGLYSTVVQILSPSLTGTYISNNKTGALNSFGCYSQEFFLKKFSLIKDEYENANSGIFKYKFGNISVENYKNNLNISELTVKQDIFLVNNEKNSELWNKINPNAYYEMWIGFDTPKTSLELYNKYKKYFDNSVSRSENSGVIWIPVKTSDNIDDICIGMTGNFSWHYFNFNKYYFTENYYSWDLLEHETLFVNSLKFLTNHSRETEMFLKSGLFKNADNIDISEKLEYIEKNGVSCLGMVLYGNGEFLSELKNDTSVNIVKITEQA